MSNGLWAKQKRVTGEGQLAGLALMVALSGLTGCSAQKPTESAADSASTTDVRVRTQAAPTWALRAPQVAMASGEVALRLVSPPQSSPLDVVWDFGDGTSRPGGASMVHTFLLEGNYTVTARVVSAGSQDRAFTASVRVLGLFDGLECISRARLLAPTEIRVGEELAAGIGDIEQSNSDVPRTPSCLADSVVRWRISDGREASGQTLRLGFASPGSVRLTADVITFVSAPNAMFQLVHDIEVLPELTPDPMACAADGQERQRNEALASSSVACGVSGTRSVHKELVITERCSRDSNSQLRWSEVGRSERVLSEGPCLGQSCRLADGSLLRDGQQRLFYLSEKPEGPCAEVSLLRQCSNGELLGSRAHSVLSCQSGCTGFGSHGTTRVDDPVGEERQERACRFGEAGVFDIYQTVADRLCLDGAVISSVPKRGKLLTEGQCPNYQWRASGEWSVCSASCGGTQTRVYRCADESGAIVPDERCGDRLESGLMTASDVRLCDGDPESVGRTVQTLETETRGPQKTCPRNQIGTVRDVRDVEVREVSACVDHEVRVVSVERIPGEWREERNCRQYVAHRCSHDSLNIPQAKGRYEWMLKCRDQVPVIAEFLEQFDHLDVSVGGKRVGLGEGHRPLYPTFLNRATTPETRWIAPTSSAAPCVVPDDAYVASVCVSSCATPEQPVAVWSNAPEKRVTWLPILEAYNKQAPLLATMAPGATIKSRALQPTRVQQWVTELLEVEQPVLTLQMVSGRVLRVTPNHPLLAPSGEMREAESFKAGDSLVELGGRLDPITRVEKSLHFGRVYNVFVESDDPLRNVMVTNGYLNGTGYFQNQGAERMNRSLFRREITRGLVRGGK